MTRLRGALHAKTTYGLTSSPDTYRSFGYHFTAPTRTDASGAYTMTLDRAGRTTAIDDPLHAASWQFTYGANGEPVTTAWPTTTALATTSAYDPLGRLTGRTTTPGPRAAYTLAYNRAGSRLTEASTVTGDPSNGTATTGYDPLGRLVTYSAPGRTLAAAWDAVPDRTTLTTDGTPVATTFDFANRPTSGGYGYDADGRMTARSGQALAWDSLGRLAEVRTSPGNALVARYGYDALDRLWKVERPGQATIRFRYAGTSTAVAQVVDDTTGTVIRNVTTGPEGTVLQDWDSTSQRLYGTNGHHDTTFTTDGAGTVTATLRYDPWGNLLSTTGSLPDWRFQGSWADTSTGLAWSVARWYDPSQGTFTSEDTLLGSPESPSSRHLYAYAQGDPVGGWDPGGRASGSASLSWRRTFQGGEGEGDVRLDRKGVHIWAKAFALATPVRASRWVEKQSSWFKYSGVGDGISTRGAISVELQASLAWWNDNTVWMGGVRQWYQTALDLVDEGGRRVKTHVLEHDYQKCIGTAKYVAPCFEAFGGSVSDTFTWTFRSLAIRRGHYYSIGLETDVTAVAGGGWAEVHSTLSQIGDPKVSWSR